MAVLQKIRLISNERLDLPDFLNLDNFACADWGQFFEKYMANTPFIVTGFEILNPRPLIGSTSTDITVVIADSVMFHPTSSNAKGGFFVAPSSEASQAVALTPNATNFIELDQAVATGAPDTRSVWDPSANGGQGAEYTQIIDTVTFLKVQVSANTLGFTDGKVPIAKVVVDNSGPPQIVSITDCRPMFFRLGRGGTTPDPLFNHIWPDVPAGYARTEPPTTITSASPLGANPFEGADKNITGFKDWMDAVMSRIKEITSSPYWYSTGGLVPGVSLGSLWFDAYGSVMTGTGYFQHSGGAAIGYLNFGNITILDSELFTVSDGVHPVKTFEFDNDGAVGPGNVPVIIGAGGITLLNTIQEFRDATISAINGAALLDVTAEVSGDGKVGLTNDFAGPQGNVAITETVANPGFTVSGMTGGQNVGTLTWTSDIYIRSVIGDYYFRIPAGSVTIPDDSVAYLTQVRNQPLPAGAALNWVQNQDYVNGPLGSFAGLSVGDFIKKDADGIEKYVRIASFQSLPNGGGIATIAANALSVKLETILCVSAAAGIWNVGDVVTDGGGGTCTIVSILKNRTLDSNDVRVIVNNFSNILTFGTLPALTTTSGGTGTFDTIVGDYDGITEALTGQYSKSIYSVITVVKREDALNSADTWWLAYRDDNGSNTARIFIAKRGIALDEGEETSIGGDVPSDLLAYIGSPSVSTPTPDYASSATDAKSGEMSYNTANGENLTVRASKLTSLIADKAQDKNIRMLLGTTIFTWNLALQTLTWDSTLTFQLPSSNNNNTLAAGSCVLLAGQVAYITLDRNNPLVLTNVVVASDATPLQENVFVWARRDVNDVLIGHSFKLQATDESVGDYSDHLRKEKMFKPVITQAGANRSIYVYPSQRLSGGMRRYSYIQPGTASKFPRNSITGYYDGGANNDQLTQVNFSNPVAGFITVTVTYPDASTDVYSIPEPGFPGTPFRTVLVQVLKDDTVSVTAAAVSHALLANAVLDDNLPIGGADTMPVAVVVLEQTGVGTIANVTQSRLLDRRPAGGMGGGGGSGDDSYDKHQDALTENSFDEIFIDTLDDIDDINAANTVNMTHNVAFSRYEVGKSGEFVDYDPDVTPVLPPAATPAWTRVGAVLDNIVGNELWINDVGVTADYFTRSIADLATPEGLKYNIDLTMGVRIASCVPDGNNFTGLFLSVQDTAYMAYAGIFQVGGVFKVGFMDSGATGFLAAATPYIISLGDTRYITISKIGSHTFQLVVDGVVVDSIIQDPSTFEAATTPGQLAFGDMGATAQVSAYIRKTSYSIYKSVIETANVIRRPVQDTWYLDMNALPETNGWTKSGTETAEIISWPGILRMNDVNGANGVRYSLPITSIPAALQRGKIVFEVMFEELTWYGASSGALNEVAFMRIRDTGRDIILALTDDGAGNQGIALATDATFAVAVASKTGFNWTDNGLRAIRIEKNGNDTVKVYVDKQLQLEVNWEDLPASTLGPDISFGTSISGGAQTQQVEVLWDDVMVGIGDGEEIPVQLPVTDFLGTVTVGDANAALIKYDTNIAVWYSSDGGQTWCKGDNGRPTSLNTALRALPLLIPYRGQFEQGAGEIIVRICMPYQSQTVEDYSVMYNQSLFEEAGFYKYYEYTAVGGETVIALPFTYITGNKELEVILNGAEQFDSGRDYNETSATTVTFVNPLIAGNRLKFRVNHMIVQGTIIAGGAGGGSGRREVWNIVAGVVPPTEGPVGVDLGFFQAWIFDAAIDNDLYFQFPVPDNRDTTGDLKIRLNYCMDASSANNVKLDINYIVTALGGDLDPAVATGSLTSTFAPGAGVETLKAVEFTIPAAAVPADTDLIACHFKRNASNVADNHPGKLELVSIEISYTVA